MIVEIVENIKFLEKKVVFFQGFLTECENSEFYRNSANITESTQIIQKLKRNSYYTQLGKISLSWWKAAGNYN